MSENIESVLKCAVCLDFFNIPKILPGCGHSVCLSCLQALLQQQSQQGNVRQLKIKCPECRTSTRLGSDGVANFKTNVQVQRIVNFIKMSIDKPTADSHFRCDHSSFAHVTTKCTHCDKVFCENCFYRHKDIARHHLHWLCHVLADDVEIEADSRSVFSEKLNLMSKRRPFEIRLGDREKNRKDENKEISKLLEKASELCQMPLLYCSSQTLFELYDKYKELSHFTDTFDQLHAAVKDGNLNKVKQMFPMNTLPASSRRLICEHMQNGFSLIHEAANAGCLKVITFLIDHCSAQMDEIADDFRRSTPIHLASDQGHVEIIKYFLELEQQAAQWKDKCGDNILHRAAANGNLELVKYLVNNQFNNINDVNERETTALGLAAEMGHLEVVKYLKNKGAHLSGIGGDVVLPADEAIHWAAMNGHLDVLEYLIEQDPDLAEEPSRNGDFPLFIAVANGHINVVNYFVNAWPQLLESRSSFGRTPLHEAVAYLQFEIVAKLVEKGANLLAKAGSRDENRTVLHMAISRSEKCLPMLEMLLKFEDTKNLIEIENSRGETALQEARNFSEQNPELGQHFVRLLTQ